MEIVANEILGKSKRKGPVVFFTVEEPETKEDEKCTNITQMYINPNETIVESENAEFEFGKIKWKTGRSTSSKILNLKFQEEKLLNGIQIEKIRNIFLKSFIIKHRDSFSDQFIQIDRIFGSRNMFY